MTNDPWALLREAKRLIAANRLMLGHYSGVREVGSLEDRIDAALAERQDSAQSAVESEVEWTQDALGHYARVRVEAEIEVFQDLSGEWQWNRTALSDVRRHGSANTLDEAKSAAIAAARGMK
jgi:hypothetical protein